MDFKQHLSSCKKIQHMEDWELDFEWLRTQHLVKEALKLKGLPDMNAILFLIGIQELGRWKPEFTKEEKQDLMHIAACRLMSYDGFYAFKGRDDEGWPHYEALKPFVLKGMNDQEHYLKLKAVRYFREWEEEQEAAEEEELNGEKDAG